MREKTVIYQRLKELREDRGMSQDELASRIGRTSTVISNMETGRTKIPSEYVYAFADIFSVSTDYLFGFTDNPSRAYAAYYNDDEFDLIAGYRKMNTSQRRILLGKMEEILAMTREVSNAGI